MSQLRPETCPKCKIPWQEEQNIYDHFKSIGKSKEEATETASHYGCTKDNPKHFGKNVVGIEFRGGYDGISQWKCLSCNTKFNRWTMKEIK
jgi:hypothetical protein